MNDLPDAFTKVKRISRKAVKFYLWSMAVFIVIGLIGMLLPIKEKEKETEAGSPQATMLEQMPQSNSGANSAMPDVRGKIYSEARAQIDKLNLPNPDYIDLLENRGIWIEDNWVVRDQLPSPGFQVNEEDRICLGVVKVDENWRENLNQWSCWYDASNSEREKLGIKFSSNREVAATVLNLSTFPVHLSLLLSVELDNPNAPSEIYLRFCTTKKVSPGTAAISMVLTPGDLIEKFDSELFLTFGVGSFRYEVKELQKNAGRSCDGGFAPFSNS